MTSPPAARLRRGRRVAASCTSRAASTTPMDRSSCRRTPGAASGLARSPRCYTSASAHIRCSIAPGHSSVVTAQPAATTRDPLALRVHSKALSYVDVWTNPRLPNAAYSSERIQQLSLYLTPQSIAAPSLRGAGQDLVAIYFREQQPWEAPLPGCI